jgi:hypothetical protein
MLQSKDGFKTSRSFYFLHITKMVTIKRKKCFWRVEHSWGMRLTTSPHKLAVLNEYFSEFHNSPLDVLCFQHVMKFAEITQEVQVSQPSDIKLDFGLTPGRRKANRVSCVGYFILSNDNQIYWTF